MYLREKLNKPQNIPTPRDKFDYNLLRGIEHDFLFFIPLLSWFLFIVTITERISNQQCVSNLHHNVWEVERYSPVERVSAHQQSNLFVTMDVVHVKKKYGFLNILPSSGYIVTSHFKLYTHKRKIYTRDQNSMANKSLSINL